ncbi:hypothetical protein [Rhodococcus sp. USK13]|uniref:hypothetical protein n=1 Tax=Rhodococcus sp. USK13 TaxID=2806442 RepID=UPI001BCD7475|nr:hypothetical protein [Rhodococcus sp. USK13]
MRSSRWVTAAATKTVRRYLQPLRTAHQQPPPAPAIGPGIRQATGWLTRHRDRLIDNGRNQLDALLGRSPALATTRRHVREFVDLMTERRGSDLTAWISAVDIEGKSALRSFARAYAETSMPSSRAPQLPDPAKVTSIRGQALGCHSSRSDIAPPRAGA